MTYWGMAAAQGPYINMDGDPSFDLKGACASVDAGRKVAAGAPERERAYLEAVATWCPEYRPAEYVRAAQALAAKWPDDLDAQTLYAEALMIPHRWKWYSADGRAADGMPEAERVLEGVLRRWPDHAGANHYYIHAVESSPTPERAIPSAQRLMGVVPWAGHLVHMPGHIWLVMGDYELAASVNERAGAVDREYMAASNVTMGTYTPYYIHNLHFIVYARWMQGRRAEAIQAANAIAAATAPMMEAMPETGGRLPHADRLCASAGTLAWDELLKMPQPSEKLAGAPQPSGDTDAPWRCSRRGPRRCERRERAEFQKSSAQEFPRCPWGTEQGRGRDEAGGEVLAARFGEDRSRTGKSGRDSGCFIYDEPPAWYYPVRESLRGRTAASRPGTGSREGRSRRPEALAKKRLHALRPDGSLEAQGKDIDEVKRELEAVWAKSDV